MSFQREAESSPIVSAEVGGAEIAVLTLPMGAAPRVTSNGPW